MELQSVFGSLEFWNIISTLPPQTPQTIDCIWLVFICFWDKWFWSLLWDTYSMKHCLSLWLSIKQSLLHLESDFGFKSFKIRPPPPSTPKINAPKKMGMAVIRGPHSRALVPAPGKAPESGNPRGCLIHLDSHSKLWRSHQQAIDFFFSPPQKMTRNLGTCGNCIYFNIST